MIPSLSTEVWKSPSGWSWAVYVEGWLRAQGHRCVDEAEAVRFMEANVKLIDPNRTMVRTLRSRS